MCDVSPRCAVLTAARVIMKPLLWRTHMSSAALHLLSWPAFDLLLRGRMMPTDRVRLVFSWIAWQALCAAVFGLSLGVYAVSSRAIPDYRFLLADVVKMPLLLFFTSAVTCPSLYVF